VTTPWKVSDVDSPLWSVAVTFIAEVAGISGVPLMIRVLALKLSPLGSPLTV
jgi:hypothetical protein